MKNVILSVCFQQESPSAFICAWRPLSSRICVRFAQELLSVFGRNECPFWARICTSYSL